jgi:hypothetical protein
MNDVSAFGGRCRSDPINERHSLKKTPSQSVSLHEVAFVIYLNPVNCTIAIPIRDLVPDIEAWISRSKRSNFFMPYPGVEPLVLHCDDNQFHFKLSSPVSACMLVAASELIAMGGSWLVGAQSAPTKNQNGNHVKKVANKAMSRRGGAIPFRIGFPSWRYNAHSRAKRNVSSSTEPTSPRCVWTEIRECK